MLTTRIAWLLQNGYATPGRHLAVTFTTRPRQEIIARLSAMLPVNVRGMWIGTFHGLCNRRCVRASQTGRSTGRLSIPRHAGPALGRQASLQAAQRGRGALSAQVTRCTSSPIARKRACAPATCQRMMRTAARGRDCTEPHQDQCQREGVVDFGELTPRSFDRLRQQRSRARALPAPLSAYFRLDEFQDTNRLQYAWLKQIAVTWSAGCARAAACWPWVMMTRASTHFAVRALKIWPISCASFDVQHQIKLEQNYRSDTTFADLGQRAHFAQ